MCVIIQVAFGLALCIIKKNHVCMMVKAVLFLTSEAQDHMGVGRHNPHLPAYYDDMMMHRVCALISLFI